ncbi:MAG: CBS domain-containing protein [Myxococcales bacterium]|nr:CBS domain-containing protein [Myxococcales bacterium]MCB9536140.1 CBS domain-containing protein [Myxococcales bacterium]
MRPIVASDLMNPEVLSVRPETSVEALARFLVDNAISGAPVVDGRGKLVGVVSLTDVSVVASDRGEDDDRPGFLRRAVEEVRTPPPLEDAQVRVRDIMNPDVFVVSDDASVSEVASVMLHNHLHRVLVTREGKVVGIITTSDLLGLLVDPDEDHD